MKEKDRELIVELIQKELSSHIKTDNGSHLPIGYNPVEAIRGGLFHWVAVPFNKIDVFCELRCPNATQIEQCGDISNIVQDSKENRKIEYDDLIQIRNYQEALCKLVLNKPTFDQVASLIGRDDFVISQKRKELEEIEKDFEARKDSLLDDEKKAIRLQIKTIELQLGYILPDDTMAFLCRWAMGNDISDIKKITRESFLRAASLARAHSKAPSDYISGVFTDYNRHEIDAYAFMVLEEFLKEQQAVKESKHQWLFGGRKRVGGIHLPKPGGK